MSSPAARSQRGDRVQPWQTASGLKTLAVLGIVVIPWMIVAGANSYDAPDAADRVRVAFATVIAAVVAVTTACLVAIASWRRDPMASTWSIVVALAVISSGIFAINASAAGLVAYMD